MWMLQHKKVGWIRHSLTEKQPNVWKNHFYSGRGMYSVHTFVHAIVRTFQFLMSKKVLVHFETLQITKKRKLLSFMHLMCR